MKFVVTTCLFLVACSQLGIAQNEEPTTPSLVSTEASVSPSETAPLSEPTTVPSDTTTIPVTESTPPSSPPVSEVTPQVPETTSTSTSTSASAVDSTTAPAPSNKTGVKIVEKLSDQIRSILEHFRDPEPIGFPGQTVITDPMPAPNTTADMGIGTGYFYNITVHGLSNFTIDTVNMLLDEMQVYVMLRIKTVIIKGDCVVETLITKSKGPFNITLTNVTAEGTVYLKTNSEGKLYANRSSTDMHYQELTVGSTATSMFQTLLNGAGLVVLSAIKPHILSQIDQRLNEEVNKQLESSPKMPSIVNMSPVDMAILRGRQYIRQLYEPYTLPNIISHDSEFLNVNVGPATVYGLSKFARVGNVTVQMREGVVQFIVRLITAQLRGVCKWHYDFGKIGNLRRGQSLFYVEHVQFEATINQSMNLRNTPYLHDLQLEVGPVRVKMDGTGDFDYLVDMVVPLIPNMLRHLIIDALEEPIRRKIQAEILDKINVEKLVEDNLPVVEGLLIYS